MLLASLAGAVVLFAVAGEALSADRSVQATRADPMEQIGVTETAAWVNNAVQARYIVDLGAQLD